MFLLIYRRVINFVRDSKRLLLIDDLFALFARLTQV